MSTNSFTSEWAPGPDKDYTDNVAYNVGETVRISWEADITNAELELWQDNFPYSAQGGPDVSVENNIDGSVYTWTVSWSGLDLSYHNVCYLQTNLANGDSFVSHYFNISGPAESTSTSSSSIPSTSSTTSPSSPSSPTPNMPTTTPPSSTSSAPQATVTIMQKAAGGGIDGGAIAGIVFGALFGVAIVIGIYWLLFKRAHRSNLNHPPAQQPAVAVDHDGPSVSEIYSSPIHEISMQRPEPPYEVDGTGTQDTYNQSRRY